MKELRVVQLSKADRSGGASIAAYRLHQGLRVEGVDSHMLVNKKKTSDPYVHAPTTAWERTSAQLAPVFDKLPLRFLGSRPDSGKLSLSWVPSLTIARLRRLNPDLANLHWVNDGFLNVEAFAKIPVPMVWTLHDMWAFCGAEHYVGNDTRYRDGYGPHNRLRSETGWDANRWVWSRKKRIWPKLNRLLIVTPSRWLAGCVRESILLSGFPVEVVPNGIDALRYKPLNRNFARDALGLPRHRKLVLFGASGAGDDPRKGFTYLLEALDRFREDIDQETVGLVVFGPVSDAQQQVFGLQTFPLGRLQDEISVALAYAAADVFVAPSVQDNLPNTVLESMACGTPVVAFNVGGMSDMITHGETGYLARLRDASDLAQGLKFVLGDPVRFEVLARSARERVLNHFTLKQQVLRYVSLYERMRGSPAGIHR